MRQQTLPTIVAACAGLGVGFVLGRSLWVEAPSDEASSRDEPASAAAPSAAPPSVPPTPVVDELAGLRACVRKLGEAEAHIRRDCAALPAVGTGDVVSDTTPVPVATAGQRAPRAIVPGAPTAGAAAPTTSEPSAAARAFSEGFMARVVGTTDAESRWLQEYVCLVDDRRRRTETDLAAILGDPRRASDPAEIDAVVTEAKEERDAMLADIEARLGKDRYKRMRDLGGFGVLSRSCPPRAP